MKFGIVVFPGSNCEKDCHDAVTHHLGQEAVYLWHEDRDLQGVDAILLPGGFSYGDYLRSGAIAPFFDGFTHCATEILLLILWHGINKK